MHESVEKIIWGGGGGDREGRSMGQTLGAVHRRKGARQNPLPPPTLGAMHRVDGAVSTDPPPVTRPHTPFVYSHNQNKK